MKGFFKYLKGCYKEEGEHLFSLPADNRVWTNGMKLKQRRFRLDIRKNVIAVRTVQWTRLSMETVDCL